MLIQVHDKLIESDLIFEIGKIDSSVDTFNCSIHSLFYIAFLNNESVKICFYEKFPQFSNIPIDVRYNMLNKKVEELNKRMEKLRDNLILWKNNNTPNFPVFKL